MRRMPDAERLQEWRRCRLRTSSTRCLRGAGDLIPPSPASFLHSGKRRFVADWWTVWQLPAAHRLGMARENRALKPHRFASNTVKEFGQPWPPTVSSSVIDSATTPAITSMPHDFTI